MKLQIEALTLRRRDGLIELFEGPGASIARGCYCMCCRRTGKHTPPPGVTYSEANKRELNSGPACPIYALTRFDPARRRQKPPSSFSDPPAFYIPRNIGYRL